MTNYQVVPTANLVFETASDSEFDKDSLGKLVLNLNHLLHELRTVRVKLWVDFEDGLLHFLRVEHDGPVTARNYFFLSSHSLNQRVNRLSETVLKHLFLHFEFFL